MTRSSSPASPLSSSDIPAPTLSPSQYFPSLTQRLFSLLRSHKKPLQAYIANPLFNGLGFALGSFVFVRLLGKWDGHSRGAMQGELVKVVQGGR
mmetsp:Transcript_1888/g.6728  ORF Transcript_1888/g.6728 Transcript_1888/m.6728 type:complete len:94 (+) Transcript_1888:190-471(+)